MIGHGRTCVVRLINRFFFIPLLSQAGIKGGAEGGRGRKKRGKERWSVEQRAIELIAGKATWTGLIDSSAHSSVCAPNLQQPYKEETRGERVR